MDDFLLPVPVLLIEVPVVAALLAFVLESRKAAALVSTAALLVQGVLLVLGGLVVKGSDISWLAMTRSHEWIERWNIYFSVSADATTIGFVALTTLVTFCASMLGIKADRARPGAYHGLLWLTAAALCGLFVARDLVLFYAFFELMLVPLLFLVGAWGGTRRLRATMTLFVYTLIGSLFMLLGVIGVGLQADTFDLPALASSGVDFEWWVAASFVFAFAVKAPLVGLHGWLPLAYREATPEVAAVLSGLISKAAMYGMLRIGLPIFGEELGDWAHALIAWAVISLLYASIAAFRQLDARGVVSYSSIAQMGLIMIGLFAWATPLPAGKISAHLVDNVDSGRFQGVNGAYLQAINHGLVSAALFLIIGIVIMRTGTDDLRKLGGMATGRPVMATLALIIAMCALAVPGATTFAGELLILLAAFQAWWVWGAVGALAIVLAAMYVLRLLSALMHTDREDGEIEPRAAKAGTDLRGLELVALVPLVIALLVLSAKPGIATEQVPKDYRTLLPSPVSSEALAAASAVENKATYGGPH